MEQSLTWYVCRRLALGLGLIAAVSAVLLISDYRARKTKAASRVPRVALLQFASRPVLDNAMQGIRDSLAEKGYVSGETVDFVGFNAEGDMVTANTVAQSIVDGNFDMVVSISTPSLQTMASANRAGKLTHVFGVVTDPFSCEVGITGEEPGDHPSWMAGIGTFQPVAMTLELLHQMNPRAKKVGMAMNPADACSVACLEKAVAATERLGLELLVAQVENTSGVYEAATALAARGADALFIGGDNTVEAAVESVVRAGNAAKIPVFACSPEHIDIGVMVGVGANYYEVGRAVGQMAGDVLAGELAPADVAVADLMPRRLALNQQALALMDASWRFPPELLEGADLIIDPSGRRLEKAPKEEILKPLFKTCWNVHFIAFVEAPMVDEWLEGWREETTALKLVEGKHYRLTYRNAQGDMATLNAILDAAIGDGADILLTTSTPTLQATVQKNPDIPLVFGLTANPMLAGVGKSYTDHLPWLTGIGTMSDYATMAAIVRECLPQARRVGSLVNPSEDNSEFNCAQTKAALAAVGIELVTMSTSQSAEVPNGAQALASADISAICQALGNLHDASFPAIAAAAHQAGIPLFAYSTGQAVSGGAAIAVARDYRQGGRDQARMMLRVMNGTPIGGIPIENISRTVITVNQEHARKSGFVVPPSVLSRADTVIEGKE